MSVTQYIGRTFDLLALRGAEERRNVLLNQSLFGVDAAGEVCAGVQMLAQRWTIAFLTNLGSMAFRQDRGTTFVRDAQRGAFRTEAAAETGFLVAALATADSLQLDEPADAPDDEKLDGVELQSLTLSGDGMTLSVRIVSLAGDSRQVILPISILPIVTRL